MRTGDIMYPSLDPLLDSSSSINEAIGSRIWCSGGTQYQMKEKPRSNFTQIMKSEEIAGGKNDFAQINLRSMN